MFKQFYFMLVEINGGNRKQFPPKGKKLVLRETHRNIISLFLLLNGCNINCLGFGHMFVVGLTLNRCQMHMKLMGWDTVETLLTYYCHWQNKLDLEKVNFICFLTFLLYFKVSIKTNLKTPFSCFFPGSTSLLQF